MSYERWRTWTNISYIIIFLYACIIYYIINALYNDRIVFSFFFFFFLLVPNDKNFLFSGNTSRTTCPDWDCVPTTRTTWTSKASLLRTHFFVLLACLDVADKTFRMSIDYTVADISRPFMPAVRYPRVFMLKTRCGQVPIVLLPTRHAPTSVSAHRLRVFSSYSRSPKDYWTVWIIRCCRKPPHERTREQLWWRAPGVHFRHGTEDQIVGRLSRRSVGETPDRRPQVGVGRQVQ